MQAEQEHLCHQKSPGRAHGGTAWNGRRPRVSGDSGQIPLQPEAAQHLPQDKRFLSLGKRVQMNELALNQMFQDLCPPCTGG